MVDNQRLSELTVLLALLYEKLGEFEKELVLSANVPVRFELKQRIKRELLPDIRRYEAEYWDLYPTEMIVISEQEAENHIHQVKKALTTLEMTPQADYPSALLPLLQEIRAKLGDDKSASAKLKLTLPLIPAIAAYELEMDTEKVMQEAWRSLKNWIRK